jgi:hypothetical protein
MAVGVFMTRVMTCVVTPCVRILMGVGMVVVMIVRVARRCSLLPGYRR